VTVAVSLNLSDGVILGVDSAVTIFTADGTGIAKVYEQAEKLFQLSNRPIGLAFYGAGGRCRSNLLATATRRSRYGAAAA
jgi:hypothetical protein